MSSAPFLRLDPASAGKLKTARPDDGIPLTMCRVCGFPGPHAGPVQCITALRDRIAVLEFKARYVGGGRRRKGE